MGAKHGTYAGWNQHRVTGTRTCQPCRDAAAAYKRSLYAKRGRVYINQRADVLARQRASARLQAAHPEEFYQYFDSEYPQAVREMRKRVGEEQAS